jgi:hypothetical protein
MLKTSAAVLAVLAGASIASAVDVKVGPSTSPWLGYMNVFDTSFAYQWGSPWGVPDLVSVFDDANSKVTLKVNSINDPNPYWYTPSGGPGAAGNKVMDANTYVEVTNQYAGETLTFSGEIISNNLAASHGAYVFIKDFAPDYSSFLSNVVPLPSSGTFSVTMQLDPGAGRHVQWGFEVIGPCVWITDSNQYGSVVIKTVATNPCPADFNFDGFLDFTDFDDFVGAFEAGNSSSDFNGDGFLDFTDFDAFVAAFEAGC